MRVQGSLKILVRVKTGKREIKVEKLDETNFVVAIKARAEKGRANAEVVIVLADYFHVPKSDVEILSGHTSKIKTVQVFNISSPAWVTLNPPGRQNAQFPFRPLPTTQHPNILKYVGMINL